MQPKRLGQPSKNISVLDGFLLVGSCSSATFSKRKSSQWPSLVVDMLSTDGVTEAPVHLAIRSSTGLLTFSTKEISFANRSS